MGSEAINKATAAGKLKKKLNSKALFCIFLISKLFCSSTKLDNLGKITVLIATPAIARLI